MSVFSDFMDVINFRPTKSQREIRRISDECYENATREHQDIRKEFPDQFENLREQHNKWVDEHNARVRLIGPPKPNRLDMMEMEIRELRKKLKGDTE